MDSLIKALDRLRDRIDSRFSKMEDKLHELDSRLDVYNEQLTHHIEGVKQNRHNQKLLKEYIDIEKSKLEERLYPLEKYVSKEKTIAEINKDRLDKFLRFVGVIATITSITFTIYRMFIV